MACNKLGRVTNCYLIMLLSTELFKTPDYSSMNLPISDFNSDKNIFMLPYYRIFYRV